MTLLAATGVTPTRIAGKGFIWLLKKSRPALVTAAIFVCSVKAIHYIIKQHRRRKWNNIGENIVVLHSFPRGYFCPNVSPFVVKLETYLRMAEIPYEIDFDEPLGPKGKCPWITLNKEEIADSQLIMERLGELYNKDFSTHLTMDQRAVGRSMRIMVEEHFFWCFVIWRFMVDEGRTFIKGMKIPWLAILLKPLLQKYWKDAAKKQGMGRHSLSEIEAMGTSDLQALSIWLGDKPYLMGDRPTEVDCAIFGMLSQIQWNSSGSPYFQVMENDLKNLSSYCYRMKENFWPDWHCCLNLGQCPQKTTFMPSDYKNEVATNESDKKSGAVSIKNI